MENILTDEELKESEAFHNLMNDNMWKYISWYSFDEDGSMKSSIGAKTIEKINQLVEASSLNVIHSVGYYGMTIFHQLFYCIIIISCYKLVKYCHTIISNRMYYIK